MWCEKLMLINSEMSNQLLHFPIKGFHLVWKIYAKKANDIGFLFGQNIKKKRYLKVVLSGEITFINYQFASKFYKQKIVVFTYLSSSARSQPVKWWISSPERYSSVPKLLSFHKSTRSPFFNFKVGWRVAGAPATGAPTANITIFLPLKMYVKNKNKVMNV